MRSNWTQAERAETLKSFVTGYFLAFGDELQVKEIAKLMAWSEATVRNTLDKNPNLLYARRESFGPAVCYSPSKDYLRSLALRP